MVKMLLCSIVVSVLLFSQGVLCLTHTRTLMWTIKSLDDGSVDVRGIPGDPEDWVFKGITEWANSYFTDPYSRAISRRVALAFQYSSRRVFFSDKGFKEIFRITLQVAPYLPFSYNVSLEVVYGGISTEVNGLAMDWASGSLYWTDALYNWITVANASDYNCARHIVYTGFSRPMGIAVHPKRGVMFWSSIGAVPKIERATLSGTSRVNFIDSNIDRPLGMSIDYKTDHLYWVDDLRDTIERVELDNIYDRRTVHVGYRHSLTAKLFALAVYNDFIFATDQLLMAIDVYNKTTGSYIMNFSASVVDYMPRGIPYDIQMYDSSLQEDIDSDCQRLQCQDICISDGGKKAHCMCQEGYTLSPIDQRSCDLDSTFQMPEYLYSISQSLCGTDVIAADQEYVPTDVKCFYSIGGHEMVALGFNSYASYLFFSDSKDSVIHRMLLNVNNASSTVEVIAANTGQVTGISVDWVADNIYWTVEDRGVIMVSRLTGRYSKVLIDGINSPKSIAVNPLNGTMYWAIPDSIYIANMDGSDIQLFLHIPGAQFDGMVLDIRKNLLYWVDQSLPGIRSCRMDGTGLTIVLQSDITRTFRDVTVYENYMAWTSGTNSIYFGVIDPNNSSLVNILRGLRHVEGNTSHDIITYDYYLQPLPDASKINPCDIDNDVYGCDQLCLLTPNGRQCTCSSGFQLVGGIACVSETLLDNFLLFVDPYAKTIYQYDLRPSSSNEVLLKGISLQSANLPSLVAFDRTSQNIFWYDEDRLKNSIKMISVNETVHYHVVTTLTKDVKVGHIDAEGTSDMLLYNDAAIGTVYSVDEHSGYLHKLDAIRNVFGQAFTTDDRTGYVYWVDYKSSVIYKCDITSSCFTQSGSTVVSHTALNGKRIVGLSVAQNADRNLVMWTSGEVYIIGADGTPNLVYIRDTSFNFSSVVMVDNSLFFASPALSVLCRYDIETASLSIILEGFSRIADLKAYCSVCNQKPTMSGVGPGGGGGGPGLSAGAKAGIAIGSFFFLLLLLLLLLLLVLLWRRRRPKPVVTPTIAYTNAGYDRLNSVIASLSSLPEGAEGFSPYDYYNNNNVKEKKGPIPFPGIYDDDPPLYFANDEAKGGIDFFAQQPPGYEEKPSPYPEVSADELPIFKVDGSTPNSPVYFPSTLGEQFEASPVSETIDTSTINNTSQSP